MHALKRSTCTHTHTKSHKAREHWTFPPLEQAREHSMMDQGEQKQASHAAAGDKKLLRKKPQDGFREPRPEPMATVISSSAYNEADQLKKELSWARSELQRLHRCVNQLEASEQTANQANHRLTVELSGARAQVEQLVEGPGVGHGAANVEGILSHPTAAALSQAQAENRRLCNMLAEVKGQYHDLAQDKSTLQTK